MFLPAVELRHLSKFYREGDGERVVLRDAAATLGLGEIGVLIGRSGSGKSTVLNLISEIDRPSEGTVRVNGTDLTALDEGARTRFRREHIGFIFQFFNLIPLLTVEENLFLPLELLGRADARGRAHALALLARVGLADRARAYPDRLSGGEQQRVAVARALVHDPALVLADEPTGNLDADAAKVVLDLLDGLARELGKTVVMATHSREVIGVADRVFLIQQGHLVEQGPVLVPRARDGA
jgi:putative ABC transport system ATP-binding protein